MAPKQCAKRFCGQYHFLGGRFLPPSIVEKYKLRIPPCPGTSMFVRIGNLPEIEVKVPVSLNFQDLNVEADPFVQVRSLKITGCCQEHCTYSLFEFSTVIVI